MDLTTLTAVKSWLGVASFTDDTLLTGLISQVSGVILSYLQRPDILKRQWIEPFTGSGQTSKMLRQYPVISVSNVTACNQSVPAYWFDPDDGVPPGRMQMVHLECQRFDRQCQITYTAGYVATETHTGPTVTLDALNGSWARDEGVAFANGTPLVKVASSPTQGQYSVSAGVYTIGDTNPVTITYSYVPRDLELACIEIVGERYRYKSRIGQTSQSANGQTTSAYSLKDMPDFTKLTLQPFKRPPVPV